MKYTYIASKILLKYKANITIVFYDIPTQFLTFPPFPTSNPIRWSLRGSYLFGSRQCTSNPRYTSICGKYQWCITSKNTPKHKKFVALLLLLLHLQACNLPTLASRRHYLKLCLLYQIVKGHLNFPIAPIVPRNLSRCLRNTSTLALERPVTHTNAHKSSFFPHIIALWNSLPPSAQNCRSLHSFKQTIFCHTFNTSSNP